MIDTTTEAGHAIAQHVIKHVLESSGDNILLAIPDACADEIDIHGGTWNVDTAEATDDGRVVVHATKDVRFTGSRIRRATRTNPPEYRTCRGTLMLYAAVDWTDDALCGDCRAEIEYLGDRP